MIENFDNVKKQLSELAGVINSFKSEAVQLRIIELVLGASAERDIRDINKTTGKRTEHKRKNTVAKSEKGQQKEKKKTQGGKGAVATLTRLIEGDFFKKPRTINDIIMHCKNNLARTFKANEFSGKLGRMVRYKKLTRSKNADKQYEYQKP